MRVTVTLTEEGLEKHKKGMKKAAIADFGKEEAEKEGYIVYDDHLYGADMDCSDGEINLFLELPFGWITIILTADQFETIAKGLRKHVDALNNALCGAKNG